MGWTCGTCKESWWSHKDDCPRAGTCYYCGKKIEYNWEGVGQCSDPKCSYSEYEV